MNEKQPTETRRNVAPNLSMELPMFSDGRDPAHTCACCGHELRPTVSMTLQVEETVLGLCNQAFAEAESSGHARVDVAHVISALARTPEALTIFWQLNIDPAAMTASATRWLTHMDRRHAIAPLTASDELKTLLARAEARALRDGRTHASLSDLIGLLADLSATPSERSAREIERGAPAASRVQSSHGPALQDLLTTAPPRNAEVAASRSVSIEQNKPALTSTDQPTLATLLARLDRQEAELVELRAAVAASASARSRSSQSASTRSTSRGQTFLPGHHVLTTQSTTDRIYLRRCLRQRQDQTRRLRNRINKRHPDAVHERQSEPATSRSWSQRRSGSGQSRARTNNRATVERDDDAATTDGAKRFYLALDDHIERAPSIGPKTAGRLVDAGIPTVRELLAADAEAVSAAARTKFITAQRVRDWQAQARLVCTVPFLRGTHAQLLVGAGYANLEDIVAADPSVLCAAILKFATTRDGQSVLRSAPPPDIERILRWLQNAAEAEPTRAAA